MWISGLGVYGVSCSDVGLGSGICAVCILCSKEISIKDFMEGFNVLEMDPSPQDKSHSCIGVISSVVTNVYYILHRPSASAQLFDRFLFPFFLFSSESCSPVNFLQVRVLKIKSILKM